MEIFQAVFIPILMFVFGFVQGRHYGWVKGFETCKSIYNGTYVKPERKWFWQ
jgi:hypothetical protein